MAQRSEPGISGTIVRGHFDAIATLHGPGVRSAALAHLDEDQRSELEYVLPLAWVRVSSFEAFYTALAKGLGVDLVQLHSEVARRSVARTYQTVWRILFRVTSNEALVARTPIFHSKAFDTGRLSSRMVGEDQAEIELTEWPTVSDFVIRHLCIGMTTLLELAGRKGASVVSRRQADGAFFAVKTGS
jgi:hypothetical protein